MIRIKSPLKQSLLNGRTQEKTLSFFDLLKTSFVNYISGITMVIISTLNYHFFSQYCGQSTTSAYAIAVSFFNILGLPVITSLTNALNIASSQGFGAEKLKVSLLYFETAIFLQFSALIFILIGMGFIVEYTNFSPFPDNESNSTFRTMVFFVFSERIVFMLFYNVQTLLFSFQKFQEISIIVSFSLVVHYLSISVFGSLFGQNGIFGAILGNSLLNLGLLVTFIKFYSPLPPGMNLRIPSLRNMLEWERVKKILTFSQSIYFQVLGDCLSFNALIIFTSGYGSLYVTANVIFVNLLQYSFRYCISLGSTVNTEVGIRFGKRDDIGARAIYFQGFKIIFVVTYLVMATFMVFKNQFISIFTHNESAIQMIDSIWFFMLLIPIPSDALQNYFMTVINSLEEKEFVRKTTQIAFYLITIPSAYLLGTVLDLQLLGIWLGMTLGNGYIIIRSILQSREIEFHWKMVIINQRLVKEEEMVVVHSLKKQRKISDNTTDL